MAQEDEHILDVILNNISCQLELEEESYYLLVKKQQSGSHSLLFLTDFSENIWVKKINFPYLMDLKNQLKVKTSLKVFAQHLSFGMKEQCKIKEIKPFPILLIKMKISQGLVMNCRIKLDNCISFEDKPERFKSVLKVFGKQLFQAKNNEIKMAVDSVLQKKSQQKTAANQKQSQSSTQNKLFAKPQARVIPEKHRDLINPLRKKRQGRGMRIRRDSSQSESQS